MAFYTFLLALGAALPLAASYSDSIQAHHSEGHIQGGAYQRRDATTAPSAEEQAQPERPLERQTHLGAADGICVEQAPCAPGVTTAPGFIDSRGS